MSSRSCARRSRWRTRAARRPTCARGSARWPIASRGSRTPSDPYAIAMARLGIEGPAPAEAALRARLVRGGYRSRGLLRDALLIAVVETGVGVWATDDPGSNCASRTMRSSAPPSTCRVFSAPPRVSSPRVTLFGVVVPGVAVGVVEEAVQIAAEIAAASGGAHRLASRQGTRASHASYLTRRGRRALVRVSRLHRVRPGAGVRLNPFAGCVTPVALYATCVTTPRCERQRATRAREGRVSRPEPRLTRTSRGVDRPSACEDANASVYAVRGTRLTRPEHARPDGSRNSYAKHEFLDAAAAGVLAVQPRSASSSRSVAAASRSVTRT